MEIIVDKNPKDNKGLTPLHYAAKKGHEEVCEVLIYAAKEKNPKDENGITPLHFAAENGHKEICSIILEEIEDKNPKSKKGNTPLHFAAKYGHEEVCLLIIEDIKNISKIRIPIKVPIRNLKPFVNSMKVLKSTP